MDGFDQDKHTSQRDKRGVVLLRLLAPHGDTFEAFDLADEPLDAGP